MNAEKLYSIALTRLLPYQSQVQRQLIEAAGTVTALYEHRHELGDVVPDTSERLRALMNQWDQHLARAEQEMSFAERSRIRVITHTDEQFPARLNECPDAPIVLYYRGTADLNSRRILSIVGTRKATPYGTGFCHRFLSQLSHLCPDVLIVSGLAYGIDISAHRNALQNHLPTIGVLAHGLDQIYPRLHRQTAIEMLQQGGLLTEFMSQSTAEKMNFVARNRIVAGIADAALVVESADKGGSLITARIATEYGRDVFAVPGRVGDATSAGCNKLIRDNQASLVQTAQELAKTMGWDTANAQSQPIQRELFPQLSSDESIVFNALKGCDGKHLNLLAVETNLPVGKLSSLLFDMEMRGIIRLLSGGTYRII